MLPISYSKVTDEELASHLRTAGEGAGYLILTDLPQHPDFSAVQSLFQDFESNADYEKRANSAYSKNLVFKDSFSQGYGGPLVDQKRVLDLSPERLNVITVKDKMLLGDLGTSLQTCTSFFESTSKTVALRLLSSLASIVGNKFDEKEYRFNYRLAKYYERPSSKAAESQPPRCGEHQDFGPMTFIFQQPVNGVDCTGLEVFVNEEWQSIPSRPDQCVVLFGICTAWRSNSRLKACKHRVVDMASQKSSVVPQRLSAVLFVGLKSDSILSPTLRSKGEGVQYKSCTVGEVHPIVARKWKAREGTITMEELKEEERIAKSFSSQEALISHLYKLEV
eukprot:CAMPEP_0114431986 /NCGR_PEP_ID=MMETSP0103-20121206/10908_1 /TAXON_ID=37642 ORGANISM="Paraphysomonas imperforata, Strain PA2" /NCGR_SAMPLE_ID=MMETSP0103 /ASSEMBLY_ACC=CAM_ASM_000201 /LENGTH=334 /DNA_ID=CAMNT_0001601619 /DNA_START=29 /DNA_END=1033 /DNA_ORIENTATION=+